MTDQRAAEMWSMRAGGATLGDIASRFGVTPQRIGQILGRVGRLPTTEDAFWERVDKTGGPDACWPWTGSRNPRHGYGMLSWNGRFTYAHRVAVELTARRTLEKGEWACHHCDNPPCCNPAHVYAGTPKTNAQDRQRRNRTRGLMPGRARAA